MQNKVVCLKEWEKLTLSNYDSLTISALMDLQERDIIDVKLSKNGIEITSRSMVGFESNDSFSLTVEPKVSNFSVLKMIGYVYGFIPFRDESAYFNEGEAELKDLLIYQWLSLVQKLLPKIRSSYVTVNSQELFIKGKIDFKKLSSQGVVTGKTPIKYKVLRFNHLLNQIIKSGLVYFKKTTLNPFLVTKIDLLLRNFTSIDIKPLSIDELQQVIKNLTRIHNMYKVPLEYLYWLLQASGIQSQKCIVGKSMWINMNTLFQDYLTKILLEFLSELSFKSEVSDYTIFKFSKNANPLNYNSISIRPDLLIFKDGMLVNIVDFKYKSYSEKRVSTSDLYQLSNYGLSVGQGRVNPIILYPAEKCFPDQIIEVRITALDEKQQIVIRGANLRFLEAMIDRNDFNELRKYSKYLLSK
jgi:5-methylcytosine-specific restriction enzyme subunit McrC